MRARTAAAALAATLLLTAACGGSDGAGQQPPPGATSSREVTASTPTPTPTTGTSTATGRPERGQQACAETRGWTTAPEQSSVMSREALYLVRAGQHRCFDRVVFDINGASPVGYSARYVRVVAADGSGQPIPVAGGAALEVVVRAPALGFDEQGHQPGRILARTGDYFYSPSELAGWRTLRAVRFAGSFEGQCTFAVGVRAKLPMRVLTVLDERDRVRHVVVDVAHR